MGYNDLSFAGKIVYKAVVKVSALAFFIGAYIFALLILIYPLRLFEQIGRLRDPFPFILGALLFASAWLFPAAFALAVKKTKRIYPFYLLLVIFWLLDALLFWLYALRS